MKFQGDVPAFEAACLEEIRTSLERCDRRGLSPFRTLLGVALEGTYPDTAVMVMYRYKAEYGPTREDLRESFAIWGEEPYFKPFAPFNDEMWSDAGEQEAFLWSIEPD